MLKFFNRVGFLTSTEGQGTISIGAALSPSMLTPAEAGAEDGDETAFVIEDGSDFEIVRGVIGDSVTTLTRVSVANSKIGGVAGTDKIELSGSARVRFISDALLANTLWRAVGGVVQLADTATPELDASLGNVFRLEATADRVIAVPSNPRPGQKIVIQHYASGGARTLGLNTGAGGFRFGVDVTGLTATASGKTDYIGAIFNAEDNFWDVVAYAKGY